MSVKIQLNSLEALERLIGGDSEIEVSIRANIASEFAGKHLRPLINSPELKEATESIKRAAQAEAQKQIAETVGSIKRGVYGFQDTVILNESFKSEVNAKVKGEIAAQMNELLNVPALVAESLARYTPEYLAELIDKRIDYNFNEKVKDAVKIKLANIAANIA